MYSRDSFLSVSFRAIVLRIFIADQRIQGISLALDLLRDTEAAHALAWFYVAELNNSKSGLVKLQSNNALS